MNKIEAYKAMLEGNKVANEYYTHDEYIFINKNGFIESEDGCIHGGKFSESWDRYQDPENKLEWNIWFSRDTAMEPLAVTDGEIHLIDHSQVYNNMKWSHHLPIVNEPKVHRNEPCFCGSGKKYKKCCG